MNIHAPIWRLGVVRRRRYPVVDVNAKFTNPKGPYRTKAKKRPISEE